MSCKLREDGVALADAILFEQACERPLKINRRPVRSKLFESVQVHSVHSYSYRVEIIFSNTKANHHNAFEF